MMCTWHAAQTHPGRRPICPYVLCSRVQLPILSKNAVTVRKAHGMTWKEANVYVHNIFCSGQLYTALSRIQKQEDLRVIGAVNEGMKLTDPVVLRRFAAQKKICVETWPDVS